MAIIAARPGTGPAGRPALPGRRLGGVTLIERLVVIATIAILAGLLLSAISRKRSKAQGIGCLSHLKHFEWVRLNNAHCSRDYLPLNSIHEKAAFPVRSRRRDGHPARGGF